MPEMIIRSGDKYLNGAGDIVFLEANTTGWFDGLPFIVRVIEWASIAGALGLGGPAKYTVNAEGHVWNARPDRYDLTFHLSEGVLPLCGC
jgi:hypothetical protein